MCQIDDRQEEVEDTVKGFWFGLTFATCEVLKVPEFKAGVPKVFQLETQLVSLWDP